MCLAASMAYVIACGWLFYSYSKKCWFFLTPKSFSVFCVTVSRYMSDKTTPLLAGTV